MDFPFDPELMIETTNAMVKARIKDLSTMSKSHNVAFATSVMASTCAEIAGLCLASVNDEDVQLAGAQAFIEAMVNSMRRNGAQLQACQLIKKVKDQA